MAIEKELLDQLPHAVEWLSDNGSSQAGAYPGRAPRSPGLGLCFLG
jgi:hypothetical protein